MELTILEGIAIDPNYALAGAVTGFVVGLTGVGGGALMTPLLLLIFGIAPHVAIATDLWFAAITKLIGAAVHNRRGHIDWGIVTRLWAGSLPAAASSLRSSPYPIRSGARIGSPRASAWS